MTDALDITWHGHPLPFNAYRNCTDCNSEQGEWHILGCGKLDKAATWHWLGIGSWELRLDGERVARLHKHGDWRPSGCGAWATEGDHNPGDLSHALEVIAGWGKARGVVVPPLPTEVTS